MGALAVPLMLAGTAIDIYGKAKQAKEIKKQGKFQQKLNEEAALREIAGGQRRAGEEKRQADLLASRALAVASASGADPSGVQITDIIADIDGEGAYRAAVAMYEGEANARSLRLSGTLAYESAKAKASATKLGIASSIIGLGAGIAGMSKAPKLGGSKLGPKNPSAMGRSYG